eukprot:scaffold119631_cov30-Tisochrysis_lutea.AAC.1
MSKAEQPMSSRETSGVMVMARSQTAAAAEERKPPERADRSWRWTLEVGELREVRGEGAIERAGEANLAPIRRAHGRARRGGRRLRRGGGDAGWQKWGGVRVILGEEYSYSYHSWAIRIETDKVLCEEMDGIFINGGILQRLKQR